MVSRLRLLGACFLIVLAVAAIGHAQEATIVFSDGTPEENDGFFIFSDGDPAETGAVQTPPAAEMPMLVNAAHLVPDDYKPADLVMMADYCDPEVVKMKGSKIEGERMAVDALLVMFRAAIAEGVSSWQVNSGWRSVGYQQEMWDNKVYSYRQEGMSGSQARSATARYVAKPGASEHHTGLAFDLSVPGQEQFSSTKQYRWLAENCWDYGFIIRFTAEKKAITGINDEPWHVRYVGLPHSQIMKETGECLEEYLGEVVVFDE